MGQVGDSLKHIIVVEGQRLSPRVHRLKAARAYRAERKEEGPGGSKSTGEFSSRGCDAEGQDFKGKPGFGAHVGHPST